MARPTVIKFPNGGEVHLKNLPTEETARLKELLTTLKEDPSAVSVAAPTVEEVTSDDMPHTALSIVNKEGKWYFVTVKFNDNNAAVETMLECDSKMVAVAEFKLAAINKNIV